MEPATCAVIFDLDGVLTDTAELHYQSWKWMTEELGIPFDRRANEALRGLGRMESLDKVLGEGADQYSPEQQQEIARRKNEDYVRRVQRMTWADLLPGAADLLHALRARQVAVAIASSSKNAKLVVDRLGIGPLLDALVDGHDIDRSKPDPQVFHMAADRLNLAPSQCVVVEDAASGVEAALAAGMRVVGLGPPERVGRAHLVKPALAALGIDDLVELLGERAAQP